MRINIVYTHRSHRYDWESSKDDKILEFELEVKKNDTIEKIKRLIRTRYSWAEPDAVFIEGVHVPFSWYTLETFYINDGDTIHFSNDLLAGGCDINLGIVLADISNNKGLKKKNMLKLPQNGTKLQKA